MGQSMPGAEVFSHSSAGQWTDLGGGNRRRVLVYTEELMMVEFAFEKDGVGAPHSHPHVQASYVAEGRFEVTVAGETAVLAAGESFIVPPNAIHGGKGARRRTAYRQLHPAPCRFPWLGPVASRRLVAQSRSPPDGGTETRSPLRSGGPFSRVITPSRSARPSRHSGSVLGGSLRGGRAGACRDGRRRRRPRRHLRFAAWRRPRDSPRCRFPHRLRRTAARRRVSGSLRPRSIRSPTGRPRKSCTFRASVPLTQMRVPSCLFASSSRAAILMVSP